MESAPGELPDEVHEPAGGKRWKWYHGDLLLLEWYLRRGVDLEWDTVFVMQWDMLVFAPLQRILPGLRKNEIYFSGLRPVSEIEEQWTWTSAERHPEFRANYLAFISHLENHFGHVAPPLCCLAIIMALPRVFFEKFAQVPQPALGFIEYKLPTYADLFGIRLNTVDRPQGLVGRPRALFMDRHAQRHSGRNQTDHHGLEPAAAGWCQDFPPLHAHAPPDEMGLGAPCRRIQLPRCPEMVRTTT